MADVTQCQTFLPTGCPVSTRSRRLLLSQQLLDRAGQPRLKSSSFAQLGTTLMRTIFL